MRKLKYGLFPFVLCFIQYIHSAANGVTPQYLDNLLNTGAYDEFIDILKIPGKDLVDPSQRKSDMAMEIFYNGIGIGDILFRPGQYLNPGQDNDFNGHIKLEFKTWMNGTVPYYMSNTFTDNQTQFLQNEIHQNNKMLGPNVVYRPYQEGDADYVFLFNGGSGRYSNFGNVGGPQVISFPPPMNSGGISHELQHTLGFGHEHNRMDRDDYIKLIPEHINEELKMQYVKYTSDNLVNLEPYDYYSIMSYPVKVPGFNLTAYDVLQTDIDTNDIGVKFPLRPSDIRRVKRVYPHP